MNQRVPPTSRASPAASSSSAASTPSPSKRGSIDADTPPRPPNLINPRPHWDRPWRTGSPDRAMLEHIRHLEQQLQTEIAQKDKYYRLHLQAVAANKRLEEAAAARDASSTDRELETQKKLEAAHSSIRDYHSRMEALQEELSVTKEAASEASAEMLAKKESLNTLQDQYFSLLQRQREMEDKLSETEDERQRMIQEAEALAKRFDLQEQMYQLSLTQSVSAPKGTVAFVFTDVQGSTQQWEEMPEAMSVALAVHNRVMRRLIRDYEGYEVKTEGDAFMITFSSAQAAVEYCLEAQLALLKADWPAGILEHAASAVETGDDGQAFWRGFRVRMGIHYGSPSDQVDPVTGRIDYFGPVVNRAARVEGSAKGGQIVASGEVMREISLETLPNSPQTRFLGSVRLKGLSSDTDLHEVWPEKLGGRKFELPSQIAAVQPRDIDIVKRKANNLRDDAQTLDAEFATLGVELDQAKTATHSLMTAVSELKVEWIEDPADAVDSLRDELKNIFSLYTSLEEHFSSISTSHTRQNQEQQSLRGELDKLEETLAQLNAAPRKTEPAAEGGKERVFVQVPVAVPVVPVIHW